MVDARLLDAVGSLVRQHGRPDYVPLIGIAGSQGSGKSTLARAAAKALGTAQFSLDDVYLTKAERVERGRAVHPLFAVRGPPGTHDLGLLSRTITALRGATEASLTALPAFDKLSDDRAAQEAWPVFEGRPTAILVEGWCLGATAQGEADLAAPLNDLERDHDPEAIWRRAVNEALGGAYAETFAAFDAVLFLRAPGFDTVLDWRCEQEAGLLGIAPEDLPGGRRAELAVFVQGFERLTRHTLAGGVRADVGVQLDRARRVVGVVC
jgi:D-glycerate 3-kinase